MNQAVKSWILFIGLVLLLLGIFGSLQTTINLLFLEKYPTNGVLNIGFTPSYYPRESDCFYPPAPTFDPSGNPVQTFDNPSSKLQQETCLAGIAEDRQNAKANDISKSFLFLILGLGILTSPKYLSSLFK